MLSKKICYLDVCSIDYLKKNLIMLKSHNKYMLDGLLKKSFLDEKLIKLFKNLRAHKYQPKCNKKISVFQVEKEKQCFILISARVRCIVEFFNHLYKMYRFVLLF